jgi:Na+/H+ antiporter NhaD/arsenite permease-like protein
MPQRAAGFLGASAPAVSWAADRPHAALEGDAIGLVWVLPFAGLLLSIALLPLLAPHAWHRHYGKVAAFWAATFLIPFAARFGWLTAWSEFVHVFVADYVPFIVLLLTLYVAAGGARLKGTLSGSPASNTLFLLGGTGLASVVGTTGACMLLIEPLMRANAWRKRTSHTWMFFIFLVGNIGGALTPLGDPPLYIGFLQGVDFFWPTTHLAAPMMFATVVLLAAYFALDARSWRRETGVPPSRQERWGFEGGRNLVILAAVAAVVAITGFWDPTRAISVLGVPVTLDSAVRTTAIAGLGALAWFWTDPGIRRRNTFSWAPIEEVSILFAGIFICIIPAIAIIAAGAHGPAAPVLGGLNADGHPDPLMYFWITGILSSILDNAPTYLLFFNFAGGDSRELQTALALVLEAISAGAVFMGALTYIGNAPNFMVRAIVTARGHPMPSFFGYIGWTSICLLPLFVVLGLMFF